MLSYSHSYVDLGQPLMNNAKKLFIFSLTRGFQLGEVRSIVVMKGILHEFHFEELPLVKKSPVIVYIFCNAVC